MGNSEILNAIIELGKYLDSNDSELLELSEICYQKNGWFTRESVRYSYQSMATMLNESNVNEWFKSWEEKYQDTPPLNIGIVMAGNIPMVGVHDLLCVLASGNRAIIKLSSKDEQLIPCLIKKLISLKPEMKDRIKLVDKLANMDAAIATGSNNSARYFEYYFRKFPHIIRKNRTSVAVLNGHESEADLTTLGNDIFRYFGLGCRNVTKLFVPENYTFDKFFEAMSSWSAILQNHNKYMNNYDYNRAILLMNGTVHLDNNCLLLTENEQLFSPMACMYYEGYKNEKDLHTKISAIHNQIQCIVSKDQWFADSIPLGVTQEPGLSDYADNVNTMEFLLGLRDEVTSQR
ncbi:acyl-CoA reductase [bacterium AH-315-C07]|nr:acyl-CoA reductase [bacterium AH-315-C07]